MRTDTRSMEWLTDGGTDFFKITSGVLQGNTLVPYLFSICLEYVLRRALGSNLEEGFTLHIAGSRRYFDVKIIDVDYSDDLAVLSDRLTDATRLLHHSEKATNEVGLISIQKTPEFLCYNQHHSETIKSLKNKNIKVRQYFTYLRSSIA